MSNDAVTNLPLCRTIASEHPYPLIFTTISGAHLYGFASGDSDYDLRGVHVLPAKEVLGLHATQDTVQSEEIRDNVEIDLVTHDLAKFCRMMLKKNGYVLEQLLSPLVVQSSPEHEELKSYVPGCLTRYHAFHYLGFAQTQWDLFSKEAAPRVKPLLYLYRVLLTGIHLMRTGFVEANLLALNQEYRLPFIDDLVNRKVSGHERETLPAPELAFHHSEYMRLRAQLETERDRSQLPEHTTAMSSINDLLVRIRLASISPANESASNHA